MCLKTFATSFICEMFYLRYFLFIWKSLLLHLDIIIYFCAFLILYNMYKITRIHEIYSFSVKYRLSLPKVIFSFSSPFPSFLALFVCLPICLFLSVCRFSLSFSYFVAVYWQFVFVFSMITSSCSITCLEQTKPCWQLLLLWWLTY